MCVPLGHRNGRSHRGGIKTKISKAEVEEIITTQSFDICQWIPKRCRIYRDCDLSIEEILVVLKNETTKVSVANTLRKDYMWGYRTIVMEAPSIKAKFIFRIKK